MADLHVNGQPWQQQYLINGSQVADVAGWLTGTSLPVGLSGAMVAVTIGRVFLLGGSVPGSKGVDKSDAIYTATIATDGTIGAWTSAGSLPYPLTGGQVVYTKDHLYLIGGTDDVGDLRSSVYFATVAQDGTIGSWTAGASLPGTRSDFQAVVTLGKIHLVGGQGSDGGGAVYTGSVSADGTISSWGTGPSLSLGGNALLNASAVLVDDSLVLLGGFLGATPTSSVWVSTVDPADGTLGAWSSGASLPTAIMSSACVATEGRVFLFGGDAGSGSVVTVYSAPVDSSGNIGTWATATSSLAVGVSSAACFVTSSKVYVVGGWDADGDPTDTVQLASFSGGANDYSGELFVATSGDVFGDGSINSPLETVSGSGSLAVVVYGDGSIVPPLETTQGSSTVPVGTGIVAPRFDTIMGGGETAIVGWGTVKPKTTRFSGQGVSGVPIAAGIMSPRLDVVSGSATATIAGWGSVRSARQAITGSGSVAVSLVGVGAITEHLSIVFASGAPAVTGSGCVGDALHCLFAQGGIGINGSGSVNEGKHLVNGRGSMNTWTTGFLQFERDTITPPSSPASTITPLSFSR